MIARCTAHQVGDQLVLMMADSTVESRILIDETMDPAEALKRISNDIMPVRFPWSHDELDEAVALDG